MATQDAQQQQEQVDELKATIKERAEAQQLDLNVICFKDEPLDEALQRFLQARKFDLEETLKCISSAITWRNENASKWVAEGKSACLQADETEVKQFYKGGYAGHCKIGRPIWYEQTGNADISALHCLTTDQRFTKYHVCLMEELQDKYAESSKLFGRTINKTLSILDLQGVTMAKLNSETLNFVKCIAQVDSDNYPETMGLMLIINAPGIFQVAWKMIKGFLDPRTVSKIEIFGDKSTWKPRLAELVDDDQLPAELEGKGPPCLSAEVPFIEKDMASGDQAIVSLAVDDGDKVTYRFFTRPAGNIVFKLVFKPVGDDSKAVELVPSKQYSEAECSNNSLVHGTVTCPGEGLVEAIWEHPNWWSRTLLYRAFKEIPNADEA